MTQFSFEIGTPTGGIHTLEIEGDTPEAARRALEEKGYFVFREVGASQWHAAVRMPRPSMRGSRISPRTFLVFNQELLALVKAGLPLLASIELLGQRAQHPRLRAILGEVQAAVRGGAALSASLAKHPRSFPALYTAALHAGEQSGNFVESLGRYVEYQKRILAIRQRFRAALTYPVALFTLSMAVVLFLLIYVVPTFTMIYSDAEASLPVATRMLVTLTGRLRELIPLLAGGVALAGLGAWQVLRTPGGRRAADRWTLQLPFVGEVVRGYVFSRFARTLAMTLTGGIPMIPALETSLGALGNMHVSGAIRGVVPRVAAGSSLEAALEASGVVPPLVLELVAVGETSGSLGEMLGHVADLFDADLDTRLATFAAVIEPIIMVAMGLVVAVIVVIMYLPIFNLAAVVR